MSILGTSGLMMNPYMYMNSGLSGLSGYTGVSGYTGLSGLGGNTSMLGFASILQKALESLPACGCNGCTVQEQDSTTGTVVEGNTAGKKSTKSNSGITELYADYLQNNRTELEKYRSSLRKSLEQSGKIASQNSRSQMGQSSYVKHALDSYQLGKRHYL